MRIERYAQRRTKKENMKPIIATSENYNSLQIMTSVTYHYEDGTSKTYELVTDSKSKEEDFDLVKDIATRINNALQED